MNHYPHHIGDYAKKTKTLSTTTSGAYRELLDVYYTEEKPLPLDHRELYGMAKAKTGAERKAVEYVIAKFFERCPDGYRNKRADEEIVAYRKRAEQARLNGTKGGRRQRSGTDVGGNPVTEKEPIRLAENNQSGKLASSHKPVTSKPQVKDIVGLTPDAVASEAKINGHNKGEETKRLRAEAVAILDFLNTKTGRRYEPVPANIEPIVARLRDFKASAVRQVIAKKCREWGDDDKMNEYLRPKTLFNRTNFANYAGEIVEIPDDDAS